MLSSVLLLKRFSNVLLRTSIVNLLRYNHYAFHTMQSYYSVWKMLSLHALARTNKDCEDVLVINVYSCEIWHSLVE